jgi:hypothetical protein
MTKELDDFRLPASLASNGDPVAGNPFPRHVPEYAVWEEKTRIAEEMVARLNQAWLMTGQDAPTRNPYAGMLAKFEIWAERSISVVWSDHAVNVFDDWLVRFANESLRVASEDWRASPHPVEETMARLRNAFGARVQHWKAEARRYRAEQIAQVSAPFVPPDTVSATIIARRNAWLKAFRKAKNYTVADLARTSGFSETAIRGIVREDHKRFADGTQTAFLAFLGVSLREWYGE